MIPDPNLSKVKNMHNQRAIIQYTYKPEGGGGTENGMICVSVSTVFHVYLLLFCLFVVVAVFIYFQGNQEKMNGKINSTV